MSAAASTKHAVHCLQAAEINCASPGLVSAAASTKHAVHCLQAKGFPSVAHWVQAKLLAGSGKGRGDAAAEGASAAVPSEGAGAEFAMRAFPMTWQTCEGCLCRLVLLSAALAVPLSGWELHVAGRTLCFVHHQARRSLLQRTLRVSSRAAQFACRPRILSQHEAFREIAVQNRSAERCPKR